MNENAKLLQKTEEILLTNQVLLKIIESYFKNETKEEQKTAIEELNSILFIQKKVIDFIKTSNKATI